MELRACGQRFTFADPTLATARPERQLVATPAAMFGDQAILARLFETERGHEIDLGEFGAFAIGAGEQNLIQVLRWPLAPAHRHEFMVGPALLSSLAAQRVFALHASAFRIGASGAPTIAVTAPSGTGKSTLARAARERGWERLADDLLPMTVEDTGLPLLWPHFPQLKLPDDQQYPEDRPSSIGLTALVVLERGDVAEITPFEPRSVMRTVLSSTLSSRLFPPAVMQNHLHFAGALADAVARGGLQAWQLRVREDAGSPATAADQALSLLVAAIDARGAIGSTS